MQILEKNAFYLCHEYYYTFNVVSDYAEFQIFFSQKKGHLKFLKVSSLEVYKKRLI